MTISTVSPSFVVGRGRRGGGGGPRRRCGGGPVIGSPSGGPGPGGRGRRGGLGRARPPAVLRPTVAAGDLLAGTGAGQGGARARQGLAEALRVPERCVEREP